MTPSWPELGLGLVFVLLVLNAARRGFTREGSLLLGIGVALWLAGRCSGLLAGAVLRDLATGPVLVVVYLGLALALLTATAGMSALAAPLVRRDPLRALDRLAGLGVGLLEASLVVGLLVTVLQRVGFLEQPPGPTVRAVELANLGFGWLASTIPPEILAQAGLR